MLVHLFLGALNSYLEECNDRANAGTALMQDGRRYDGEWESDLRSGFGIFRWPFNYAKNGGTLRLLLEFTYPLTRPVLCHVSL